MRTIAIWLAWGGVWLASGCAGLVTVTGAGGACESEHESCVAMCRADLQQPRDCEMSCDFDARLCARRQKDEKLPTNVDPLVAIPELGPPQTTSVDLRGGRIESTGAHVTFGGPSRPVDGAYQLDPGGTLRMTFSVPQDAREVRLTLLHGAGGEGVNCFVTMAVGDQPVLGRYAPPRPDGGLLRPERWDVGFALPAHGKAGERADVTVFVYNNQAAGSRNPYLVAAAELTWRQPVPPK